MAAAAATWTAAPPHVSVDRRWRGVCAQRGSPRYRESHSMRASGTIRMKPLQIVSRRVTRGLMKHAAMVSPGKRGEWVQAMTNELDYLSPDTGAIRWALGCIFVCYSERIHAMIRSLESFPRWMLALEMLICFLPLTLVFITVVLAGAHGAYTLQAWLLYCSGAVLGPLGLVAAFRSIFLAPGGMSRATIAGLCLVVAWTLAAYTSQILTFGQSHLSDWWREFVIIAVLPTLAVLHLVSINFHRRGSPAMV